MPSSIQECEAFLRAIINVTESADLNTSNRLMYLPTDIILSGYLLQNKYGEIDIEELIELVGITLHDAILTYLGTTLWQYLTSWDEDEGRCVFSQEMMTAINNVYNEEALDYIMSEAIPDFDARSLGHKTPDLSGYEFLEYINTLRKSQVGILSYIVASALANGLPDTEISVPLAKFPEVYLVKSDKYQLRILVCVFPRKGSLSKCDVLEAFYKVCTVQIQLREKEPEFVFRAVLLGPDVNADDAFELVGSLPYIHYLWSISAIRFFHMFGQVKQKADPKTVAKHLTAMLPDEKYGRLWAREGIKDLRKRVGLANYLIHIYLYNTDEMGVDYKIAVRSTPKGNANYELDRDYDNSYENRESMLISVNNEYQGCIVVEYSQPRPLNAGLQWIESKEMHKGLSIFERQIVVTALAKFLK